MPHKFIGIQNFFLRFNNLLQLKKCLFSKEKNYHTPLSVFRSWSKIPPIWSYHSDGSGRDSYVLINNGGLTEKDAKKVAIELSTVC